MASVYGESVLDPVVPVYPTEGVGGGGNSEKVCVAPENYAVVCRTLVSDSVPRSLACPPIACTLHVYVGLVTTRATARSPLAFRRSLPESKKTP